MSRELKRVALDFNWPLSTVWEGYLNRAARQTVECKHCERGFTPEAAVLADKWYGYGGFKPEDRGSVPFTPSHPAIDARARRSIEQSPQYYGVGEGAVAREAQRLCDLFNHQWSHHLNDDDVAVLLEAGRLTELTHDWSAANGWQPKVPAVVPSAADVNAWSLGGMGHDAINLYMCQAAECKRLGVALACTQCDDGRVWVSAEAQAKAEAWQETEPPAGEGYQMWETVSEGAPISPVFATASGLAQWLADNRKDTADEDTTAGQWLAMIEGPGWVPSAVGINGVVVTGSQAFDAG